jgi:acyl carrier protein
MTKLLDAKALLADATHCAVEAVPNDARIGSFERWDSLAHMHLLLALEGRIGRTLDPDEAVAVDSLADVARLLENPGPV